MLDPNVRARLAMLSAAVAQDGSALLGAALIAHGCGQIYAPLEFIAAGAFLLLGAWLSARKSS